MQKERELSTRLGGQLDGAALSYLSRSTTIEVISSDEEAVDTDSVTNKDVSNEIKQEPTSLIDPSSRALTGSYSDFSDPESDFEGEETAVKGTAEPKSNLEPHDAKIIASPTTFSNTMDYFDVSNLAPLPPSSDTEESLLLSLSHAGTLGKRKRTTSPNKVTGDDKRTKREPISDSGDVACISNRERRLTPQHTHHISSKPVTDTTEKMSAHGHNPPSLSNHSSIPTGPRGLGGSALICYYWYHKGECIPKRNHGRCRYAHTLDVPHSQVSMPPGIVHHHPNCPLPLCPHRAVQNSVHVGNDNMEGLEETPVKSELSSPRRGAFPVNVVYSSSPRDSIMQARYLVKGRKNRKNRNHQQLPKLTGANRQRFKSQKKSIEKWQAENDIKPFDAGKQREEKMELKKMNKELKKQKRLDKRRLEDTPLLKYEDDASREWDPAAIAFPARERSKRNGGVKLRRRANELFEADIARGGRLERFDPEAEPYKQSFRPIEGFPEHTSMRDTRKEVEDRTTKALGMVDSLKDHQKLSRRRHLRATSLMGDRVEVARPADAEECGGHSVHASADSITEATSQLPMGEERMGWDTDLVRQLFG
jgi:hypothetical protein